jgi:hypothetical protein
MPKESAQETQAARETQECPILNSPIYFPTTELKRKIDCALPETELAEVSMRRQILMLLEQDHDTANQTAMIYIIENRQKIDAIYGYGKTDELLQILGKNNERGRKAKGNGANGKNGKKVNLAQK